MFQRRTLFVLGAGSSNEVNMPLGTDLAKMIANKLDIQFDGGALVGDGDRDLFEEFSECNPGEIGASVTAFNCQVRLTTSLKLTARIRISSVTAKRPSSNRSSKRRPKAP
jgi:hypothetical protein